MILEYDADGNVQKITGLIHSGKNYTITFISGSQRSIDNVGHVTQQLVHLPVPSLSLSEALYLTYEIASALGEGPADDSANPVKPVSGIHNNRFIVNFFDTSINLYDVITFINMGVKYIDDAGHQLSDFPDIQTNWDSQSTPAIAETIAIIEWKKIRPKKIRPWWCWLVPWRC